MSLTLFLCFTTLVTFLMWPVVYSLWIIVGLFPVSMVILLFRNRVICAVSSVH